MYSLLPQDEIENEEKPPKSYSNFVLIACLILDLFVFILYIFHSPANSTLPILTPYVNLSSSTGVPFITSHARLLLQYSSTTHKTIQYRAQPWHSSDGTLPSDIRRLFITPLISTIAQFRATDYGMGNCALAITAQVNESATANIDIWGLQMKDKLNPRKFTRPDERTHQGKIALDGETAEGPRFACESGTFYAFELSCEDCRVDILGGGKKSVGLYMKQYPTL